MKAIPNFLSEDLAYYSIDSIWFYFLTFVAGFLLYKWLKTRKNLPPGPYGLPFVGYIPFIGDDPSKKFNELSKKYGSIFSVRLGSNLMIILNDYEALKEVYSNPNSLDRAAIFDFFVNLGFSTQNGEEWQEQRRASIQITRDLGIGKSPWENLVQEEVKHFAEILELQKGNPVDFGLELRRCIINNFISLLIGRNLKDGEERQLADDYVDVGFSEGSAVAMKTQSTIWRKLVQFSHTSDLNKKSKHMMKFFDFLEKEIEKHKTSPEYEGRMDFINLYLEKMKKTESVSKKNYFTDHSLFGNVNVLFLAAVDTTYTTAMWLFRLMAKYPEVQRRVQKELDEGIGENETISYDNRAKIPYTVAIIMETLRYSSFVPLSTTRSAVADFEVRGYTIPKGSQISANFKWIHYDPKYWERPEEFRPERFLKNGGKDVESNPLSYAPFSFGRRNCPGERILWMEVLVCFTMVCHRFSIQPPPGEDVHFKTIPGLVEQLKPQPLRFIKRL